MDNRIKAAFDNIHASEELKNVIKEFLAIKTQNYTSSCHVYVDLFLKKLKLWV